MSDRLRWMGKVIGIAVIAIIILMFSAWMETTRAAGCHQIPPDERNYAYNPTGWQGCTVYGEGIASHWGGPGIARNDCLWPWEHCTPISITNIDRRSPGFGRSITVTPTMFGDLYLFTADQRLVDLSLTAVRNLGFDPAAGLYKVRVCPARGCNDERGHRSLPDTAID